jgi:hypothetical protein
MPVALSLYYNIYLLTVRLLAAVIDYWRTWFRNVWVAVKQSMGYTLCFIWSMECISAVPKHI